MPEEPRTALAVCLALAAILGFDIMGIMVRLLSAEGYSAAELSAYRNVLGVLPSLVVMFVMGEMHLTRAALGIRQWRLALTRGLFVAVAQMCFYTALSILELATISALAQTNAMFVVLIAVVLLRERVGLWRIFALVLGFVGAVWILRPGSEAFTAAALLPIAAAFFYSLSLVTVRLFDRDVSNALLYLYSSVASAGGGIALALITGGFSQIGELWHLGLIFVMSMAGGIAVLLLMFAYRMAAPSLLAPFGYLGILSAFAFGWLFFDEAPIDTLFPGVFLIVGAGAVIIWRENIARKPRHIPEG